MQIVLLWHYLLKGPTQIQSNSESCVSVGKAHAHNFLAINEVLFIFSFIYVFLNSPCPHQGSPWRDHFDRGPRDFPGCARPPIMLPIQNITWSVAVWSKPPGLDLGLYATTWNWQEIKQISSNHHNETCIIFQTCAWESYQCFCIWIYARAHWFYSQKQRRALLMTVSLIHQLKAISENHYSSM